MFRYCLKRMAFAIGGSKLVSAMRAGNIARSGAVTILNLHRVSPPDGSAYRPLSPKLLRELLKFLGKRFRFLTFDELSDGADSRPAVILSFDDGYKDFIDFAAPILDEFGVRCNHNVIPECIESGMPPLNVLAQDFIGKAPESLVQNLVVPGFGRRVQKGDGAALSSYIKNRAYEEQQELKAALIPQFFSWDDFAPTAMMDAAEVRQVSNYHELGAHSYSHATMGFESDEYLTEDVKRCEEYFAQVLGLPLSIYAFPNGSCRVGQISIVKSLGVQHVLLVGNKFGTGDGIHPRFTFDAQSAPEARFKALGGMVRVPA